MYTQKTRRKVGLIHKIEIELVSNVSIAIEAEVAGDSESASQLEVASTSPPPPSNPNPDTGSNSETSSSYYNKLRRKRSHSGLHSARFRELTVDFDSPQTKAYFDSIGGGSIASSIQPTNTPPIGIMTGMGSTVAAAKKPIRQLITQVENGQKQTSHGANYSSDHQSNMEVDSEGQSTNIQTVHWIETVNIASEVLAESSKREGELMVRSVESARNAAVEALKALAAEQYKLAIERAAAQATNDGGPIKALETAHEEIKEIHERTQTLLAQAWDSDLPEIIYLPLKKRRRLGYVSYIF
ncbi:hypothetical protein BJ508DRAFT_311478 [Ascobolus immersus RN42]|uniref:Uncharacterized protein n=1 Tax=Ascobolus immersus RN42 TaxID=1160509 RepID=A0A3N4HVT1_ASCIM|nr:hypothetical protein BJ508DRAFT_311478 [Ascobolus immersus RN42]